MWVRIITLVIRHVKRMRRVILSSVAFFGILPYYVMNGTIFGKQIIEFEMWELTIYNYHYSLRNNA